ncbi:sterile alpha motif domain-containing protein 15-like [Clytia hemisphaerica]|uniref:SAM domain-containing protein n=1 Tax=Clytia hemisphaerica TaxID=252671 RepID=A0A7M5XEH7_9CNID|eukprot:TCONS_00004064-protein
MSNEDSTIEKNLKLPVKKYHKTFDHNGIPFVMRWSIDDVAEWVTSELKFPQYKDCFRNNYVSGKRLVQMTASNLPRMGITDFEHIKKITYEIRQLLGIEEPNWNRSITLPPKDTVEHYLERKSVSGRNTDGLTFEEHVRYLEEFKKHGVPEEEKHHWTETAEARKKVL